MYSPFNLKDNQLQLSLMWLAFRINKALSLSLTTHHTPTKHAPHWAQVQNIQIEICSSQNIEQLSATTATTGFILLLQAHIHVSIISYAALSEHFLIFIMLIICIFTILQKLPCSISAPSFFMLEQ